MKLAFMALFLWVQGATLADAAEHADQPHEHYGITCDLNAVATQVAPLPASPELPETPRTLIEAEQPTHDYRPWTYPPERGPPARAPPRHDR